MRIHRRDDRGMALINAVLVTALATGLMLTLVGNAVIANRESGRDRQRTGAVQVAETAIDQAYLQVRTADPYTAPCTGAQALGDVSTVVRRTYVATDGTRACPLPPGKVPDGVLLQSEATTVPIAGASRATRRMESYVTLRPVAARGRLSKAIFADGTLDFDNAVEIKGTGAPDADVYTNSAFTCDNSADVAGSLISQGSIRLENTCSTAGDLHAVGDVSVKGHSRVGGRALSSAGSITFEHNQAQVVSTLQARGSITYKAGCGTAGKCTPGSSTVPVPLRESFPALTYDRATWQAHGYREVVNHVCSGSGSVHDVVAGMATAIQDTVLVTNCALTWSNNSEIRLNRSLAIIARGGFTSQNQLKVTTTDAGTVRDLMWIVPSDAATRPCTTPSITTHNHVSTVPTVRMLLYSPCDITFRNHGTYYGQIYGGSQVGIRNNFSMTYSPVLVPGVVDPAAAATSYEVGIVYKRETSVDVVP